jgi:uncharacterized protein YutE (UPF0331/DUF86 family)
MDEVVVLSKLDSLRRCTERIRSKTPESATALLEDYDLQDIICVNLERAVQICVDIAAHILADKNQPAPDSMGESFAQLHEHGVIPETLATHLAKAVGFRNIAVHAYRSISWEIVFSIITERLKDFSDFARHVADRLDE